MIATEAHTNITCTICLNNIEIGQQIKKCEAIQDRGNSEHFFHKDCLVRWLETNDMDQNSCPTCGANIHCLSEINYINQFTNRHGHGHMWDQMEDDVLEANQPGIVNILRNFMESQGLNVHRFGWCSIIIDYGEIVDGVISSYEAQLFHTNGIPDYINLWPTLQSSPVNHPGWTERQCRLCQEFTNVFLSPNAGVWLYNAFGPNIQDDPFALVPWSKLQNPCPGFEHLGGPLLTMCNDCYGHFACEVCGCQALYNSLENNRCVNHQAGPTATIGGRKKKRKTRRKTRRRKMKKGRKKTKRKRRKKRKKRKKSRKTK